MRRRDFFRNLAAAGTGLATLKSTFSYGKSMPDELAAFQPDNTRFWRLIREQFLLPDDYAYFNTGGLGASPYVVLEETQKRMSELEVYPRPGYDHEMWAETKSRCAGLLGCKSEEVGMNSSTTEGNDIIVNGLPLKKGDEIITSTHEHAGLNIPLLNRMQRDGIVLKTFEPDMKDGMGNLERIDALRTGKTRLIFVSHITCTTGQRFPETEIARYAKDHGIWCAFDGAQVAGNMPIDVKEYDCDFYATGGHKWVLGPKRTGFVYVRESLLDTLRPITVGAYSDAGHDIVEKTLKLNPTAQRYEYATQNGALFYGLGVAIDFLHQIGLQTIWKHNKTMAERLYHELQKHPRIEILSPEQEEYRTSLITFKVKGKNYRDVAGYLTGEKRLRVRVVPEAGLEGVRVSCHLYNTDEELDRLIQEIKTAAEQV